MESEKVIRLITVLLLLSAVPTLDSQETADKDSGLNRNSIYLNLIGGDCSFLSLNYDRLFSLPSGLQASGKLGVGYTLDPRAFGSSDEESTSAHYLTLPHHGTLIFGSPDYAYELGLGGTLLVKLSGGTDADVSPAYPPVLYVLYPVLGCRLQSRGSSRFFCRVYVSLPHTGLVPEDTNLLFIPFGVCGGMSY
jgi:hypothetical protein